MLESKTFVKVRYAETDQMGVVHHGNYAQYLELARISWLEELGISYKSMENNGIMLPVREMTISYHKPAYFDDTLKVHTSLVDIPRSTIEFTYKIHNEKDILLTTASTRLVFVNMETKRPTRCPDYILEKLKIKSQTSSHDTP